VFKSAVSCSELVPGAVASKVFLTGGGGSSIIFIWAKNYRAYAVQYTEQFDGGR